METARIDQHFEEAKNILAAFHIPENMEKIAEAIGIMSQALQKGGKIISCGNGGSMCDAMHFAEELSGRYRNNSKALAAVSI